MTRASIVLAALATFLGSSVANADPTTFNFTGTATITGGIFNGQGTAVTGFYTYDTGLIDSDASSTEDFFRSDTPANQAFTWEISVTLGAITRTTATNQLHLLRILDHPLRDIYAIYGFPVFPSDDAAQFLLQDFSSAPPDAIAVGSGSLTGVAPISAPNLALFSNPLGSYEVITSNQSEGFVNFTVTSITVAPPLPTPVPALGFGSRVLLSLILIGAAVHHPTTRASTRR